MEGLEIEVASKSASAAVPVWPASPREAFGPCTPRASAGLPTQASLASCSSSEAGSSQSEPLSLPQQAVQGGKTAFLEALVQSNSPAIITCSHGDGEGQVLLEASNSGGARSSLQSRVEVAASADAPEQEYHEVRLVLRVPRNSQLQPSALPVSAAANAAPSQAPETALGVDGIELREQTHEEALLNTIDKLKVELAEKEVQRKYSADAAKRKAQECENLMRVVRELTESRSKLVAGKCVMAEKFAELQQEYMKVLRIADLSRTASRNNLVKADRATNLVKQVEDDLARQKRQLSALKERNCRLKLENAELRDKAALLERLDLRKYNTKSACMLEYTHFKIKETY
ncbi:g4473 [Coccomyxa elongata]